MCSSSQKNDVLRWLQSHGFSCSRTRGGHLRIVHPSMKGAVFAPTTPSDHRGAKNMMALLRRKLRADNDR